MRIDVIVNQRARRYTRRPELLDRVRDIAAGRARVHATKSLEDLTNAVRAIADEGTDLVLLSGGDGTFMAGVTALTRAFGDDRLPRIGLVPGGTVATIARNFGVSGEPDVVLRRMLRAPEGLRDVARPTLRVQATRGDAREERVGFIFGTGLVASFFDVYYDGGAGGYEAAARIGARVFVESFWGGPLARRVLDPMPCTIEVEGQKLAPSAWSLVCAAVVRDLGIHMLVTYRAGEDPDRVHLVASPLGPRALGPRAPFVLAGKRIGGPGHVDDLVRDFTVSFPRESAYVLDGDVLRADRVSVSAGPRLRIVEAPR